MRDSQKKNRLVAAPQNYRNKEEPQISKKFIISE